MRQSIKAIVGLICFGICAATPFAQFYDPLHETPLIEVRGMLVEAGTPIPIEGALISLHWEKHWQTVAGRPQLDRATTGADGAFVIKTPMTPEQPFRIHVEGEGVVQFISDRFESLPAEPLHMVSPREAGWIAGRVITPEGEPWPTGNVVISLAEADTLPLELQTYAVDMDGFFLAGPLAMADYHVKFFPPRRVAGTEKIPARPSADAAGSIIELKCPMPAALRVRVVGPDEQPATEGSVYLYGNTREGEQRDVAHLKADGARPGTVEFFNLVPGRYVFYMTTAAGGAGSAEYMVEESNAAAGQEILLTLEQGTGRVEGNFTIGDVPSTTTLSMDIFREVVSDPSRLKFSHHYTVKTDAKGDFSLGGLPPGDYRYTARGPKGEPVHHAEFKLDEGEIERMNIALPARAKFAVRGTVLDAQNQPIAQCRLKMQSPIGMSESETVTTGEDGAFEIEFVPMVPVPSGVPAYLVAAHLDYSPFIQVIQPTPGMTAEVNVTLNSKKNIRVEFVPAENMPAELLGQPLEFGFKTQSDAMREGMSSQGRTIVFGDPEQSVIEAFSVPVGVPISFAFASQIVRMQGEPVWMKGGMEVGNGPFTIPVAGDADYLVRIRLATEEIARKKLYLKILDERSGKPMEGIRVRNGGYGGPLSLADGTCVMDIESGVEYLSFEEAAPVNASAGAFGRGDGHADPSCLTLPPDLKTTADDPLEVRVVPLASGRRILFRIKDSFGNDITHRVTAVDGDLTWRPQIDKKTGRGTLSLPHTGDSVHTVFLIHGNENSSLLLKSNATPEIGITQSERGTDAIRIDFEKFRDNYQPEVELIFKNALTIPGLDE